MVRVKAIAKGESIYDLLPKRETVAPKATRYHSKHEGTVHAGQFPLGTKKSRKFATIGLPSSSPVASWVDPATFLKKNTGKPCVSETAPTKRSKLIRKGPVPAKTERPKMGLRSGTNFITQNAVGVIKAAPPQAAPEEARYVFKPCFGSVPEYLQETKRQILKEREEADAQLRAREAKERGVEVSREEREELLRLLKAKWGQLNTQFLRLPFAMDTPQRRARKQALEAQLGQIERDVRLLAHSGRLVLVDDS